MSLVPRSARRAGIQPHATGVPLPSLPTLLWHKTSPEVQGPSPVPQGKARQGAFGLGARRRHAVTGGNRQLRGSDRESE